MNLTAKQIKPQAGKYTLAPLETWEIWDRSKFIGLVHILLIRCSSSFSKVGVVFTPIEAVEHVNHIFPM